MLYYFYMIYCKNFFDDDGCQSYYIGSHNEFEDREKKHKTTCNNPNIRDHNLKIYKSIRANGGWEDWQFIHLGRQDCKTEKESRMIEQDYMDMFEPDLNMKRAYTSPELRKKQNQGYYQKDIENKKKNNKKWRDNNKERQAKNVKNWANNNKERRKKKRKENDEKNKEKLQKQGQDYYQKNKDKKLAKTACPCGGSYISCNKKPHFKTKKHQAWASCEPCS